MRVRAGVRVRVAGVHRRRRRRERGGVRQLDLEAAGLADQIAGPEIYDLVDVQLHGRHARGGRGERDGAAADEHAAVGGARLGLRGCWRAGVGQGWARERRG